MLYGFPEWCLINSPVLSGLLAFEASSRHPWLVVYVIARRPAAPGQQVAWHGFVSVAGDSSQAANNE
jgi:hypothetical protein